MRGAYRTVFFHPDPSLDWKVPVAVLVRDRTAVQVGVAQHLPEPKCLGGSGVMALLRVGLGELGAERFPRFDHLPDSMGPHFSASEPRALGVTVEDPLKWAVRNTLPSRRHEETTHGSRGQHRATIGYQFFKQRNVADYVKKTFEPRKEIRDGSRFEMLHSVSHYVSGDGKLYLMEPLVPVRLGAEKDLATIANLMWSYRGSLVPFLSENGIDTELIVYMLQGGEPSLRRELKASASAAASRVIDLAHKQDAADFAETIKSLGSSGHRQNDRVWA